MSPAKAPEDRPITPRQLVAVGGLAASLVCFGWAASVWVDSAKTAIIEEIHQSVKPVELREEKLEKQVSYLSNALYPVGDFKQWTSDLRWDNRGVLTAAGQSGLVVPEVKPVKLPANSRTVTDDE